MNARPDLEVDIGVSLDRLQRQLAAAEARMVRTANRAENGFRRSNTRIASDFQRVTRATDQLANSTQRATGNNGLRMLALQLNQVGSQGAVTGNYLQALSIQLPDLLLAFGTFGALLGTVAGPLAMFGMSLLNSADASDDLVESLTKTTASLGSIRSGMDELRDLQEKYTAAIAASAGASDATAAAVAANSKREFEARRQVLAVEVELFRIRSQENRESLRNLSDQQATAVANARERLRTLGPGATDGRVFSDPTIGRVAGPSPSIDEILMGVDDPDMLKGIQERRLAIRKLGAELELTNLAIEEANSALTGEFADVGGGAGSSAAAGGGGGGGSRAARSRGTIFDPQFLSTIAERVTALRGATEELDRANQAVRSSAEQAFVAFVTGAKDAKTAASELLSQLARLAVSAGFQTIAGQFGGSPLLSAVFGGSFAGGGFTGMGPRAGGIDGKGGFPAILHPNETVLDHTRGQGGNPVSVVVNIDAKGAQDSGRGAMAAVPQIRAAVVAAMNDANRRGYR